MHIFSLGNEEIKNFEKLKSEHLKILSKLNDEIENNKKKLSNFKEEDVKPYYKNAESCFNTVSVCRKLLSFDV